ncbi:kinase-like domain-containing protein [Nemania serpens]|nr:kinase-like domain-containing protein [Nemania serpens]
MERLIFPQEGFQVLPADRKLEEETLNHPPEVHYYPVRLGEIFRMRFQVVTKLGFGHWSTVWLCRDLRDGGHIALKIYSASPLPPEQSREVIASRVFKNLQGQHPGRALIRVVLDSFQILGPGGRHVCLIYEPHGMTIRLFRDHYPEKMLSKSLLQRTVVYTLLALDVLNQACVVHTSITPNNVLVGVPDKRNVFERLEREELQNPSPRKILPNGTEIYASRQMPVTFGPTVITDFCRARYGRGKHTGNAMPDSYRAPEVILGMEWDCKVDIWAVGVMIWHLFEGGRLFYNEENHLMEDEQHLAQMVALMGPPPKHFLSRSPKCSQYWDEDGNWIAATPIPSQTFELRESRLSPEDKPLFVTFVRRIFRWDPDERASPKQLLQHDPFLAQSGIVGSQRQQG